MTPDQGREEVRGGGAVQRVLRLETDHDGRLQRWRLGLPHHRLADRRRGREACGPASRGDRHTGGHQLWAVERRFGTAVGLQRSRNGARIRVVPGRATRCHGTKPGRPDGASTR